jgi:hypothetical protein
LNIKNVQNLFTPLFPPDVQSLMSQVNGICKSWHKIKTPSALSWFEPNPNLFEGVKMQPHWIGFPFPGLLSFLVLASTTQKSCDISHFHGILSSAKNKRDWKFRENDYS